MNRKKSDQQLLSFLPSDYELRALDLYPKIGAKELGWKRSDAIEIVKILRQRELAILGLDVLQIKDSVPEYTYDNASCPRCSNDTLWGDYVNQCAKDMLDYISTYQEKGRKIIYVLVSVTEKEYRALD